MWRGSYKYTHLHLTLVKLIENGILAKTKAAGHLGHSSGTVPVICVVKVVLDKTTCHRNGAVM